MSSALIEASEASILSKILSILSLISVSFFSILSSGFSMKASSSPPRAGAKYLPYFVAPSSTLRIVAEVMLVAYLRSRSRLTLSSFVTVVPVERCCVVFSAANAVVVANDAAENTVIADNVVAITFVLMLFFFIVISPYVVFGGCFCSP